MKNLNKAPNKIFEVDNICSDRISVLSARTGRSRVLDLDMEPVVGEHWSGHRSREAWGVVTVAWGRLSGCTAEGSTLSKKHFHVAYQRCEAYCGKVERGAVASFRNTQKLFGGTARILQRSS